MPAVSLHREEVADGLVAAAPDTGNLEHIILGPRPSTRERRLAGEGRTMNELVVLVVSSSVHAGAELKPEKGDSGVKR